MATAAATDGTLYFSDWNQGAFAAHIRRLAPNGTISSLNVPVSVGPLVGMTFDRSVNLYVSDADSNKVMRITPAGVAAVFAGTGQPPLNFGYNGDNIPATQATLSFPRGLA